MKKAPLKITFAQINTVVGDTQSNLQEILKCIDNASSEASDMIIFPECALTGYPLKDLVWHSKLRENSELALQKICQHQPNIVVVLGFPKWLNTRCYNMAGWIHGGKIVFEYAKQALPNHLCFDEPRTFTPGQEKSPLIHFKGYKFALSVCYDIWHPDSLKNICSSPIDCLINLSASPFTINKHQEREKILANAAKTLDCHIFYVNTVGGQDQLIFDGNSQCYHQDGTQTLQLAHCQPETYTFSWPALTPKPTKKPIMPHNHRLYKALKLGLKDYVHKNNFQNVCLGISGGVDSALVAKLAVDTFGPAHVSALYMPSPYSRDESEALAREFCSTLNISLYTQPISPAYKLLTQQLQSFDEKETVVSIANQNLQARLRGIMLMHYANQNNALLLNTGNKSEFSMGYCTLYGDMAGAIAPIGDLSKTQIYSLCDFLNQYDGQIPERILTRPPSAELSPNQKDSDSLPEYKMLDAGMQAYLNHQTIDEPGLTEFQIEESIQKNEYKRFQAAPILRVSTTAWDSDRKMPLTYKIS